MSQTTMSCPRCGVQYALTANYLEQFGGQQTQCTSCGNAFAIPQALAAGSMAAPPPLPALPVLPYMGPATGYVTTGAWRDGNQIAAINGTVLPGRCLKCNAPSDGRPLQRNLYWHHPLIYLLVFSPLIYVIVALCVRKRSTVHVFICRQHRSRRIWFIIGGWLSIPLSTAIFILVGAEYLPPIFIAAGIVLFIGGIVTGLVGARLVAPSRIDGQYVWLKGAGPAFLATLPNAR